MASPSRRVLGDKDKNAPIHPLSTPHLKTHERTTSSTTRHKSANRVMAESPSALAGQKRKIDHVEDAERVEQDAAQPVRSPKLSLLSDSEQEESVFDQPTQNSTYDTGPTMSASQVTLEQSFEMPQDEMSQNTLEKLSDVPMPQNTSQLPPMRPGLLQEISAGSVGLSNYLNIEDIHSTQGSDLIQPAEAVDMESEKPEDVQKRTFEKPQPDTVVVYEETAADARKRLLDQKAEEMRTRLQLALYKVQTKQTTQPFSRLKSKSQHILQPSTPIIPTLTTPKLSSSSTIKPQHSTFPSSDSHETDAAEDHIAAMRARATSQPKPAVRNLSTLPIPQLDPALMGLGPLPYDKSDSAERSSEKTPQLPSSPPLSRQNSDSDGSQLRLLSDLAQTAAAQLSSPPASVVEDRQGLTKAVSQTHGEAASGLVQLMTGR